MPAPAPINRHLTYQDVYTCPVCRHGQISAITLMDAFACNFCHHIFTANLLGQTIQVVDSSQPMAWRWNSQSWVAVNRTDGDLAWLVWSAGIILTVLPASIVGAFSYIFPALDSEVWSFPFIWAGITFFLHLTMVAWLIVEYYQYPPYVILKLRLRQIGSNR